VANPEPLEPADLTPILIKSSLPLVVKFHSFGDYELLAEVARGGMGVVFRARQLSLNRIVALKFIHPGRLNSPEAVRRFRIEAEAAASLNHPNIVTIYSVEQANSTHFLSMELVEGRSLGDLIPKGGFTVERLCALGIPLTDALAAAHARGIGHRDLKPSNVMVNDQGRVKVIDFGLAKLFQPEAVVLDVEAPTVHQTVEGKILGTPAYMSPEQIEGRTAGPAADVFAFGVLLYEWISGRHPFQAGSALATLARVLDSTPEPLSSHAPVPKWLSDIIERCLRKPANERFSSAAELLQAFDHPAIAEAPARRSSTWWRTHQVVAIGLYILASAHAWQVKEWLREPTSLWVFVILGIAGSVGGIIRGHLVFTDVMNRPHLASELARTQRVRLFTDLLVALLLTVDALLLIASVPVTAVLTMALATGIGLAAVLMEPTTTTVLLGE
jgi:serine/threonine protein kinase